jgi:hypothetical protein
MGVRRLFSTDDLPRTVERRRVVKHHWRCIVPLGLLLALPVAGAAYQERLIRSLEDGQCSLRVEADDEARSLRLRVHPSPPECHATREATQEILKAVFSQADQLKLEGTYTSLSLGRLIDYPWLCDYLANTAYNDPQWDKIKGRPVSLGINKYVSTLLMRREVTAQFEEAFGDSGYRIRAVSVEKVLVGSFRDVPLYQGKVRSGKIPFDAIVWLRLERR